MILHLPLSRTSQLRLNGRALLLDLARRDFRKLGFHLRGFYRALRSESE
jgi:hypothetical protein